MTAPFDLTKFKTKPGGHIVRGGKRIALGTLEPKTPGREKRAPFKVHHIQVPAYWMGQLEQARGGKTYHLANRILREVHIQKHAYRPGPVVLSKHVTGLARYTRHRATKDMLRLKLITIQQQGNQAPIVTALLLGNGETLRLEPKSN
jgi:hypothetical protein